MSQEGRGGSPSGFLRRSIVSEQIRGLGGKDSGGFIDFSKNKGQQAIPASTPQAQPQSQSPPQLQAGGEREQRQRESESESEGALAYVDQPATAEAQLLIVRDLKKSGLEIKDLACRVLDSPARAICRIPARGEGYVIPYFDIAGAPQPFYRTRILNADYSTNGVKYKQPSRSANHIYFPRNFKQILQRWLAVNPHKRILIITEGEKKAACALKYGFPTIGLGGVDSWKSRTILLPQDTEFYSTKSHDSGDDFRGKRGGGIKAKLPSSDTSVPELISLAQGFGDMLDLITQHGISPIIIYDSDRLGGVKAEVQRAATMLAYELVFLGIYAKNVKQVVLPNVSDPGSDEKTGLDDFIMSKGPDALEDLIDRALQDPAAFPRHPNPKGFISAQLQNRMSRKSMQQVASMILTELDASGSRYRDKHSGFPYYYDRDTHHLIPAIMIDNKGKPLHETPFGTLLYKRYGISGNDDKVLIWLASQFTGEEPIEETTPRRVIARITETEDALNPNGLALQISDSHYIAISPSGASLCTNGDKGILFIQDQVEPLDVDLLLELIDEHLSQAEEDGHLTPWWSEVMNESNIGLKIDSNQEPDPDDLVDGVVSTVPDPQKIKYVLADYGEEMRTYATYLFYISPFLLRWRGLQLPIELTVGGPGSGKSSLYALRLSILTGRPRLRNIPTDIRDWYSSIANSGGLHVVDNVHFLNKELKQRISDELCRITTEPSPEVEMRRYFTNVDKLNIPILSTFAFTAIQMPFHNEDLIQRAVTLHTGSVGREPKGNWVETKLVERGGREAWIAHHIAFLVLFMRKPWSETYQTIHRLAHLEQALAIAGEVLGTLDSPSDTDADTDSDSNMNKDNEQPQLLQNTSLPQQITLHVTPPTPPTPKPPTPKPAKPPKPSLGRVLMHNQSTQIIANDWVMQGIRDYIQKVLVEKEIGYYNEGAGNKKRRFFAADIADWCTQQEDHEDHDILNNSRKLGRYMSEHVTTLSQSLDIMPGNTVNNRQSYYVKEDLPPIKPVVFPADPPPQSQPQPQSQSQSQPQPVSETETKDETTTPDETTTEQENSENGNDI